MRQRLGLAQSLLHDPKVLILDEPTNGLDPAGIREIRDHLRMLAKERNMAVIVSSHLLSEMEMMCDRIGIIQDGRLVDVQLVKDFVAVEQVFEIELNPLDKAISLLQEISPDLQCVKRGQALLITVTKEKIPEIIKTLVLQDIRIFGIKEVSKTLEDRFLELTNQREG